MPERICPNCREETDEKTCPTDGYRTVDASQFADDDQDPLIGTVFEDRYRIESLLGRGGFGAVYKATQLAVDRYVALKVLKSELGQSLKEVARFQQEARAVAALQHPNILALYDFGHSASGSFFLVTEFLEGETLADRIKRDAPLPLDTVVEYGTQVLDALAEAHASGVIHRDLKPENLFVATQGRRGEILKLLDFGIAKVSGDAAANMTLTGTGMAIGSPRYMSPEQCSAKPVTAQSDLYSFGCILYEALCGTPIFDKTSPTEYLIAHLQEPPNPPAIDGNHITGPLVSLIMQCLAKRPVERPASAEALLESLASFRDRPLDEPSLERVTALRSDRTLTAGALTTSEMSGEDAMATGDLQSAPAHEQPVVNRFTTGETVQMDTGEALARTGHQEAQTEGNDEATGQAEAQAPLDLAHGSAAAPGSGAGRTWAVALAAVLALGVGAWLWATSGDGADTASTASGESASSAAPAVKSGKESPKPKAASAAARSTAPSAAAIPASPAPKPAAPKQLQVELVSTPSGARVLVGGKHVGMTPYKARWVEGGKAPSVRLELAGYEPLEVTLDARADGTQRSITLLAVRPKPAIAQDKPGASPASTGARTKRRTKRSPSSSRVRKSSPKAKAASKPKATPKPKAKPKAKAKPKRRKFQMVE